MFLVKIKKSKV